MAKERRGFGGLYEASEGGRTSVVVLMRAERVGSVELRVGPDEGEDELGGQGSEGVDLFGEGW